MRSNFFSVPVLGCKSKAGKIAAKAVAASISAVRKVPGQTLKWTKSSPKTILAYMKRNPVSLVEYALSIGTCSAALARTLEDDCDAQCQKLKQAMSDLDSKMEELKIETLEDIEKLKRMSNKTKEIAELGRNLEIVFENLADIMNKTGYKNQVFLNSIKRPADAYLLV